MNKIIVEPKNVYCTRLVKSEDLNHHGTLFAGRTAEWFVESGFISAATLLDPKNVVCFKIHGMHFSKPARPGEILTFTSKIVYAGTKSLVSYITVKKTDSEIPFVDGFISFIHVGADSKSAAHNIEIYPVSEEDKNLFEEAKNLKNN